MKVIDPTTINSTTGQTVRVNLDNVKGNRGASVLFGKIRADAAITDDVTIEMQLVYGVSPIDGNEIKSSVIAVATVATTGLSSPTTIDFDVDLANLSGWKQASAIDFTFKNVSTTGARTVAAEMIYSTN